jgi:hypothetical protein
VHAAGYGQYGHISDGHEAVVPGPVLVTLSTDLDPLMTTPLAQLAPVSGMDWPWLQSAVQMARISCRDWPPGLGNRGDWTTAPRVATRKPAPAAASIPPSRAFALRIMHRWGEADRADDVAAVVSELLANALRHALPQAGDVRPWPIRLGLLHAGAYVVCAVADPGAGIPVLREPDQLEESGRGLVVVASLSDQWGYCPAPERQMCGGDQGKVVWAAFAATSLF